MTPANANDPPAFWTTLPDIGVLGFSGPDVGAFLLGQFSNDASRLGVGEAQWTSYNSAKGRMLGSLYLCRVAPEDFIAWLAADLAGPLRERLARFVMRARVQVVDRTGLTPPLGVGGHGARDVVAAALGEAPAPGRALEIAETIVATMPDGRILLQGTPGGVDDLRARLAAEAPSAESSRWHWLGIRAGVPMVTLATQEQFLPQDANWDLLHGLRAGKGCYPGQEIIARAKNLARLKSRTVLLHVDAAPPAPGTRLYAAAFGVQACGTVANAAESPHGGSDLLAVVQWDALADPPLHLGTVDGPPLAQLPMPYVVPIPAAPERPRL